MRQYVRVIVTGALGLTAVMVMVGGVLAALSPAGQQSAGALIPVKIERDWAQGFPVEQAGISRPILLAQKYQPDQEKKKYPPAPSPAEEPRKMKRAAPPAPQMERSKSVKPDDDFERAGTRKLGGEVIRNKEE